MKWAKRLSTILQKYHLIIYFNFINIYHFNWFNQLNVSTHILIHTSSGYASFKRSKMCSAQWECYVRKRRGRSNKAELMEHLMHDSSAHQLWSFIELKSTVCILASRIHWEKPTLPLTKFETWQSTNCSWEFVIQLRCCCRIEWEHGSWLQLLKCYEQCIFHTN